jgi:hypothetical protein
MTSKIVRFEKTKLGDIAKVVSGYAETLRGFRFSLRGSARGAFLSLV